jgi:hypothetical protein
MKAQLHRHTSKTLLGLLALTGASLRAQTVAPQAITPPAAPPAPAASAGLVNDWLRQENAQWSPFDLGGQFRARFVDQSYFAVPGAGATAVDFRANTPVSDNAFYLLRTRIHAGWTPTDWFTVYGVAQNSADLSDARKPAPQADGPMDLQQGFVKLGGTKELPVSLKVGRQELAYGDERLVGPSDWDNITRTFDAAKLRYEQDSFWIDAFTGRVVIPQDNQFNQPNWDDWFSGLYASTRALVPKTEVQLYFLADNASAGSPADIGTGVKGNSPRDIYTIGARFQTLAGQLNGWDLNGEFAGQFGDFEYPAGTPGGVVNGQRLNQRAYATHLEGGYTFTQTDLKPRLALGFDYGSGDDNPSDHTHGTFVNLYPTNHKFYGAMDFLSWQNMFDPYFRASLLPAKGLTITGTFNCFWLATPSDFFYQVNQAARTSGGYGIHSQFGQAAGQELDLVVSYSPKPFVQFQGGFGHFFTGNYVNQTFQNLGGSHDANWGYLQLLLNF